MDCQPTVASRSERPSPFAMESPIALVSPSPAPFIRNVCPVHVLRGHPDLVRQLVLWNKVYIVSVSHDGRLVVWDAKRHRSCVVL